MSNDWAGPSGLLEFWGEIEEGLHQTALRGIHCINSCECLHYLGHINNVSDVDLEPMQSMDQCKV